MPPPTPAITPASVVGKAAEKASDLVDAADEAGAEAERNDVLKAERKLFPKPSVLEGNIAFWKRVFSEYSEQQSVVHDLRAPNRVYTVLDFQSDAATLSKSQLAALQGREETAAKVRMAALLRSTAALAGDPDAMNPEQRRVAAMFSRDPAALATAADNIRVQRGLKERTRQAMAISGQYLPEMERIFADAGMPRLLTRLPFVESSFNIQAYSKVAAAGLWQFMPSSARLYMRYNHIADERRDPWASTEAAAQHLRDDYNVLQNWPLAVTAYNYGRGGLQRALRETGGSTLDDLIQRYNGPRFGFASRNFYAEFVAATEVERDYRKHFGDVQRLPQVKFETVTLDRYVPYRTLVRLAGGDTERFRMLNPSYRDEVTSGKLYVPAGDRIRLAAGQARAFNAAYARLGAHETFGHQRVLSIRHVVKKGETLASIAGRYGVSEASLRRLNHLKKGKLKAGRAITVPNLNDDDEPPVNEPVEQPLGPATQTADADEARAPAVKARSAVASRAEKPGSSKAAPGKSHKAQAVAVRHHKVKPGQTLSGIAEHYGVSVVALQKANNLGKRAAIKAGMQLKIPS